MAQTQRAPRRAPRQTPMPFAFALKEGSCGSGPPRQLPRCSDSVAIEVEADMPPTMPNRPA